MSRRPFLAAALAVGLLAPVALVAPSAATEPTARVARPLTADVTQAVRGERVTFTAKAPTSRAYKKLTAKQKRTARLVLQRRVGGSWRTVGKARVRPSVRFTSTVPARAGSVVRYRSRTVLGRRAYAGGRLDLKVVAQRLAVAPSGTDADAATTYATRLMPARAGREVVVERFVDGVWSTVAKGASSGTGAADVTVAAAGYPAWYRVTAAAHRGIPAVSSEPVMTTLDRVPTEIAHRAGAELAPEQTLAAMEKAIEAGATSMEVDVQLTSDGVPVLVHDDNFSRTTDVEERFPGRENDKVGTFTWAEVQQLEAGAWMGEQWRGEKIPSLDQWLERLGGRTHLVLEVKFAGDNAGTPEEIAAIREVLDEELATGRLGALAAAGGLTVSSFEHAFLEPFARAHEDVPVGALVHSPPSGAALTALAGWAEEVHSMLPLTRRAQTDAVRAAGLTTSVWTVPTYGGYREALASGAEGIITDRPGALLEALNPPAPQ